MANEASEVIQANNRRVATAKKAEESMKELQNQIESKGVVNGGRAALQFVDDINSVVELGVRFYPQL